MGDSHGNQPPRQLQMVIASVRNKDGSLMIRDERTRIRQDAAVECNMS